MDETLSKFGDVWSHWSWYVDFCGAHKGGRFGLLARGQRVAPWWAKKRIVSVRFRPDADQGDGSNPYDNGELTVFWKRPGQLLGPYPNRSVRLDPGEYFRL